MPELRVKLGTLPGMSGRHPLDDATPVTRTKLVRDLRVLGLVEGDTTMVHTAMGRLGWVVGGPDTVVAALLDAVGPTGTVMAYAGWDQDPYHLVRWPADVREAALREQPPFDPLVSEANREHGRIPERMRTWPGAERGPHPEASMVAIGSRAAWLVRPHSDDEPHGPGTPFSRLIELGGSVLLLGAPWESVTLLHHAEAIAPIPDKHRVTYVMPVLVGGETVWRTYHDIDTSDGAFAYDRLGLEVDPFEQIVRDALDAGIGRTGAVGSSTSVLLPARELVGFAVSWLRERFS
jgi:aminoglycoside 3-N-acetyltransferase